MSIIKKFDEFVNEMLLNKKKIATIMEKLIF